MIGERIAWLAKRVLHARTYDAIVAPAIADLQYESRNGRWSCARAYLAVWRATAAALAGEISDDCAATLHAVHLSRAIGPALVTVAIASLFFVPMLWIVHGNSPAPWHHDIILLALSLPGLLAVLMPAIAVPISAALAGTGARGSNRAALLLAGLTVMSLVATNHALEWQVTPLRWDMFYSSQTSIRAGTQHRPLPELQRAFAAQREALEARDERVRARLDRKRAMRRLTTIDTHRMVASMVIVVPYALLGIGWSRKSRWTAAILGASVFLADGAVRSIFARVLDVRTAQGWITVMWAPVGFVFLIAAWILVRNTHARRTG